MLVDTVIFDYYFGFFRFLPNYFFGFFLFVYLCIQKQDFMMYYDRLIDKEDDNVVRHVRICPLIPPNISL